MWLLLLSNMLMPISTKEFGMRYCGTPPRESADALRIDETLMVGILRRSLRLVRWNTCAVDNSLWMRWLQLMWLLIKLLRC